MWLRSLFVCVFLGVTPTIAVPKDIAITIDDLPYVSPSRVSTAEGVEIVRKINAALKRHEIRATGFVIGQQVTKGREKALRAFIAGGHQIGNHSWSHGSYNEQTVFRFRRETARTHKVLAKFSDEARYYRFPYLHEGENARKQAAAARVLARLGYQNAPVSIDNDDWRFNSEYTEAIATGQQAAAQRIARQYLAHMKEKTVYFDRLARRQFGREVRHVLLLHMNRINADHLGSLLDWYAANGWRFIELDAALADPIYSTPSQYFGPRGVSQIERVTGAISE